MATESTETGKSSDKPTGKKAWFVVHTYSGYENKAKQALEDKIRANNMADYFGKILVPSEKVTETKSGVKRTSTRKFFPSYLFVEMELNNKTMHLVKNTPKITGFVGGATNPSPVPEAEVLRITNQIETGTLKASARVTFEKGDTVRVTGTVSGMSGMNGVVDEVNSEKSRATVLISILGRSVPVEMKFEDLEKT